METEQAIVTLMDCIQSDPRCRELYYELARAFLQQDNFTAARECINALPIQSAKPYTLSVCMIVKNEEANLFDSLSSVYDMADEVIIVDTGSIDRTIDVAEIFGAKVSHFPWTGDFSAARNHSLKQATSDWILVMDADEKISGLESFTPKDNTAYSLTTRNYIANACVIGWTKPENGGYGWITSAKVRIFPNQPDIFFSNTVHELVEPSLKIPIGGGDAIIHHYGKLDEVKDRVKGENYYQLGKDKLESEPDNPRNVIELAKQAMGLGKNREAVELWLKLLSLMQDKENYNQIARVSYGDPLSEIYIQLAASYLFLNKFKDALDAARMGITKAPLREYVNVYAHCEIVAGSLDNAGRQLTEVLKVYPDYIPALILMAAVRCLKGEHHVFPKGSEEILKLCVAQLRMNGRGEEAELLTRRESTMMRMFRGKNDLYKRNNRH